MKASTRRRLLAALFAKSAKAGLSAEFVRDELAPDVIGKRLSEATAQEILKLIEHLAGAYPAKEGGPEGFYRGGAGGRAGLLAELEDAASRRWGEDFERPLNAFVNSRRKTPTHYRFLRVADLKALKERIRGLNDGMDKGA